MGSNFNYWTVAIPTSLILAILIGWQRPYVTKVKDKHKFAYHYSRYFLAGISLVCSGIIGLMVAIESWRGIIEFLDQFRVPSDSDLWPIVITPFAVVLAVAIHALVLYYLGILSGNFKKKLLKKRYHN